jgi:DNA-binding IclR family transcriptional regulator
MADIDATTSGARSAGGIQVVARVAAVLRALNGAVDGLSLSELANRVDLPRSTVHRLVVALREEGLVASSASGRTRLGPELIRLAAASRRDLGRELRPYMEQIYAELNETVDLAVLDGARLRFIDQIAASHPLRAVSAVGETFPLYCTPNGRALLAELPPDERRRLIGRKLKRYTPHTVTDPARVLREVEEIARTGVAITRNELTDGISAAAVAIRDAFGELATIAVPIPSQRFVGREAEVCAVLLRVRLQANAALGPHEA